MSKNQVLTTRPEKIFLCDQVIQNASVLDAAIIGDLYFWLAKGKEPWRRAKDYQSLFCINEKTVRNRFKSLANEYRYLNRSRPRLNNGGFGAYKFTTNRTQSSQALLDIYEGILANSDIKSDFGEFDPDEPNYKELPRIQILLTSSIEQTQDINIAYMLDRLSWALVSKVQDELYFSSKAHLARWSGFDRKTAFRYIEKLKNKGLIGYSFQSDQLVVWVNNCPSLQFFIDYMSDKYEMRKAHIAEAVA